MVVICWSEQLLRGQFSKARTDCCKGKKDFSIAHYFDLAFTAAFLENNSQASTRSEDFIFSFRQAFLWEPHFHFLSRTSAPIFQTISVRVQREYVSRFQTRGLYEF